MQALRIGILAFTVIVGVVGAAGDPPPSDADWRWLDDAWRVIDSMMPMSTTDRTAIVTFRSSQDLHYDVPERYFEIREVLPGGLPPATLVATVISPEGKSLQEQLLTQHLKNPGATPEALQPQLLVSKSELSEKDCPELRSRIAKFAKVSIRVPSLNKIAVHPIARNIQIRTGMGDIHAQLYDENDPLVRWATRTFDVLNLCATARSRAATQ